MLEQDKIIQETKTNINQKINNSDVSFTDKVNNFFNKIDFLELSGENKAKVAIKVKEDSIPDKLYRIEIFLSGIIAALGLLQNSVAVVIGAMLIAPLLRPINGISFAISMGERKFFWTAMKVLIGSMILSVGTGFLAIKVSGLEVETSEIVSRTVPNIIDLFIAIFSAMVAVLSLRFDRLGESIAGVAIAAALMPPLAVIGIELALGNYALSFGAFMLFIANLISIILVGIVFFWMYGFNPNNGKKQKSVITKTIFVVLTIIIISIPLIHSLITIKEKINIQKETTYYLEDILKNKDITSKIKELSVEKVTDTNIKINSIISIPEGLDFYDSFKEELDSELTNKFGKNVELNVELIRTANILSSKDIKVDREKELLDSLENKLSEKLDAKTIEQQEYLKKEIVDEIRKLLKEENLKVIKIKDNKTGTGAFKE